MSVILDFETYSPTPISAGASRYSLDAEIMCLAYSIDGGEVKVWVPGNPDPDDLLDAIRSGAIVWAHNASFERAIWSRICVAQLGWPAIPEPQWRCTMAEALAMNLPAGLEQVGASLGVIEAKDKDGHRLMLKLSKPRKPTKHDASTRHRKPEELQRLYDYCAQDVRAEMDVHNRIPRLIAREEQIFHFDAKVNARGVKIDVELAEAAVDVWRQYEDQLTHELGEITDGMVKTPKQVAAMTLWLAGRGVHVIDLTAASVKAALNTVTDRDARRVLEIRQELAMSSVAKYEKCLECAEPDQRIRGVLQYYGASQTGRWGGRLIQPQNFPRGDIGGDDLEQMIEVVKRRDLELIHMLSPVPVGKLLASLLRPLIIAEEGKKFIVSDFAAIEGRGLAWAAGEQWLVDAFANGDDVYKLMASEIYKKPVSEITKAERQVGKQCLGANTMVLVWPLGKAATLKRIVDVDTFDRVYDGKKWVHHEGLIYQGRKPVIERYGVVATADHLVLDDVGGWMAWETYTNTNKPSYEADVYDLANCGPNHCFVVKSDLGMLVMHNCVLGCGYGMGGAKFNQTLANAGITSTPEFADKVVATYREKNSQIKRFWYATERAAVNAVKTPGQAFNAGPLKFYKMGDWLRCRMPAGRDICYFKPELKPGKFGDQIHFKAADISGKLASQSTYSGKLAENCLGAGTLVLTDSGYKPIETVTTNDKVHDGNGWVSHDGLISNGVLPVGIINGVWMTADHQIVSTDGWANASDCDGFVYDGCLTACYDLANTGPLNRFTILSDRGPMMVHNCIQALCRDVLVDAMSRLERRGYTVVLSVHDEVICEVPKDFGSAEEMTEIMSIVPDWAKGFPINAETFECERYRK